MEDKFISLLEKNIDEIKTDVKDLSKQVALLDKRMASYFAKVSGIVSVLAFLINLIVDKFLK